MEIQRMSDEQMSTLRKVSEHIDAIITLIDQHETSRYGSMAFTKLEECMHWMNSLVGQIPLKAKGSVSESSFVQTTQ